MSAAGLVLAGGGSARMGRDKALLEWQGKSLLAHAAATLSQECAPVCISSSNPAHQLPGHRRISDEGGAKGPLGGLAAALAEIDCEWLQLLPVDMPGMTVEGLRILQEARKGGIEAVIFRAGGRLQPQVACFRGDLLAKAQERLAGADWSLRGFIGVLRHAIVEAETAGLGTAHFQNLNSEADWQDFLDTWK